LVKRKCLAALHPGEFRRFPPASPYRVFQLGNCKEWNKRLYATKEIRPIFVEQADEIVVVTVYTYYS
jgi:hypothetical protein